MLLSLNVLAHCGCVPTLPQHRAGTLHPPTLPYPLLLYSFVVMSDAPRNKGGIWNKYTSLSKNARIVLGISLLIGGLAGKIKVHRGVLC